MDKPLFDHDCSNCQYLGRYTVSQYYCDFTNGTKDVDLYFCTQGGMLNTVVARFGNEGSDYISGLYCSDNNVILSEAKERAVKLGLL
jgi:hypothetical protein